MATHTSLASLFTAIADAIRAKTGGTAKIVADNFPTEIAAIEAGVIEVATAAEMNALLVEANIGKAYKFVGTTDDTYTNGDIYVVEVAS